MIVFTAIFISAYIFNKLFFNNRGPALIILIAALLYFLPTIAGALGVLRLYFLITFALTTCLISILCFVFLRKRANNGNKFDYIPIKYSARPLVFELLLILFPAICSILWILVFGSESVRHKITHTYIPPFPWDVVEYHFPHLVDAIQTGSLWTTIWAHYPMGCEMFHAWGFVFLRNDALVYTTHFFISAVFIFFSCSILYLLCFQDNEIISGKEIIAYLTLIMMLLLCPPLWDMQFNQIGKNDIAMSAFIIAALYFFLQSLNNASTSETFWPNLLLIGISLGISSGIKPNGMLYSIFFLAMLFKASFDKKVPWYSVGVVGLCILFLAGFWYLRPLIMLGTIPPAGVDQTVVYNLKRGLKLFISGRENLLFSSSVAFCLIMGVIWHKKDFRMRLANYSLAASLAIFCITPFSALNKTDMQLRLAPAIIPLAIIIAMATFLNLIMRPSEGNKASQLSKPNVWTYRRAIFMACVLFVLSTVAMMSIPLISGLATKPRWAWNLRGLIVIGVLVGSLSLYNSTQAFKDYKFNIFRRFLYVMVFFIVIITMITQIIFYKPSGDLPGYNENTTVYRWVYQHIHNKTIYMIGLRPYGLYGKDFSNRVIYGGYSSQPESKEWLSLLKPEKVDYLVIGRDYDQREGWYEYKPFPGDIEKILAKPNIFKLVWSDDRAMIFKIDPPL